jgi:hypothetical protein
MKYIKVDWIHNDPINPILLYSELDDLHWEVRKVEVFPSGLLQYASKNISTGSTRLGLEPVPPLAEIAKDPQFKPHEITKWEFEEVWSRATAIPNNS